MIWLSLFGQFFWICRACFADYWGVIPHPERDGFHRGTDPGSCTGRPFLCAGCSRVVSWPSPFFLLFFNAKHSINANIIVHKCLPKIICVPFSYADRLLQGQYPRHKLVKQSSQPPETAFSAFNPPKEAASTSDMQTSPSDSRGTTPSSLLKIVFALKDRGQHRSLIHHHDNYLVD